MRPFSAQFTPHGAVSLAVQRKSLVEKAAEHYPPRSQKMDKRRRRKSDFGLTKYEMSNTERRELAPASGAQLESSVSTAIEPARGMRKLSVSLPPELRRDVRQIAFDCECSETSVVEIALRLLLGAPDVRIILRSHGTRYRRILEPTPQEAP
jgi:hypothetical protein